MLIRFMKERNLINAKCAVQKRIHIKGITMRFVKERNHMNAKFVITAWQKRVTWINISMHYMKERSNKNVLWLKLFIKTDLKKHIDAVHEGIIKIYCLWYYIHDKKKYSKEIHIIQINNIVSLMDLVPNLFYCDPILTHWILLLAKFSTFFFDRIIKEFLEKSRIRKKYHGNK